MKLQRTRLLHGRHYTLSSWTKKAYETRMKLIRIPSRLRLGADGKLSLRLFQEAVGEDVLGYRFGLYGAQSIVPDNSQIAEFERRLEMTRPQELAIFSYHPGVAAARESLIRQSSDRTIVALRGIDGKDRNVTLIATDGEVVEQAKLSLSSEDVAENVEAGETLHLFEGDGETMVTWAALNCHDYSHVDVLAQLLSEKIELLVVVTYNNATRLYWEYAISDIHRLFCYVAIVNVAELGGSGVFVPFRRVGIDKTARFAAAGQIFGTRGPAETTVAVDLEIGELRRLRKSYRDVGLSVLEKESGRITPVYPSEHFISTVDRPAGPPPVCGVIDEQLGWNGVNPLVAIAQLTSMSYEAYISSRYRLSEARGVTEFEADLEARLRELERTLRSRSRQSSKLLDFLIFPEVFLPRRFVENVVRGFVDRVGCIALCGVDYPGTDERENHNACLIVSPGNRTTSYGKITRSQYDALSNDKLRPRMPLRRGDTLYRFNNGQGQSFGVLICYDFSHADLVSRINLEGRDTPLDLLFVSAHNPFSNLYRSCCIADSHRFYQHVVMCNVSQYGGSGAFAPVRTSGARQTLLEIGVHTEAIALVELDLKQQWQARQSPDEGLHRHRMMRKPGIFQQRHLLG